jgi:hypothetical protein
MSVPAALGFKQHQYPEEQFASDFNFYLASASLPPRQKREGNPS